MLIRGAEIGTRVADCRIDGGRVAAIEPRLRPVPGEVEIDARGGALVAGLADHHIHLLALAARRTSLDLEGEERVLDAIGAAARAAGGRWVRAAGWDEVRHGTLDRDLLDRAAPASPVRVEHRSGALWILNSAGLAALGPLPESQPGLEREPGGRLSGRFWRSDRLLRERLDEPAPSLAGVGAELAAAGVTHVTDATPDLDASSIEVLARAAAAGDLPQHLLLLGAPDGTAPLKIVVADHDLPDPDELTERVRRAHAEKRPVAVHCVSREALALTIAAVDAAGPRAGDRIEHCALADPAAVAALARLGVAVVTQPSLVARRGDSYLARHPDGEHGDLWRYGSLLAAGIPSVPSSDAPYGDPDPWMTLRAARDRQTSSGAVLGPDERVPISTALAGLQVPPGNVSAPPRKVALGEPADLALLRSPLRAVVAEPDRRQVAATLTGGRVVYAAE